MRTEKGIEKAIERLEKMYFDEQEQEIYEAERKRIMDKKEEIKTAEEKGLERGIEKGLEKGIEKGVKKGQVNSAVKLLKKGYSEEEVIELLEINQAIIEAAKGEINQ